MLEHRTARTTNLAETAAVEGSDRLNGEQGEGQPAALVAGKRKGKRSGVRHKKRLKAAKKAEYEQEAKRQKQEHAYREREAKRQKKALEQMETDRVEAASVGAEDFDIDIYGDEETRLKYEKYFLSKAIEKEKTKAANEKKEVKGLTAEEIEKAMTDGKMSYNLARKLQWRRRKQLKKASLKAEALALRDQMETDSVGAASVGAEEVVDEDDFEQVQQGKLKKAEERKRREAAQKDAKEKEGRLAAQRAEIEAARERKRQLQLQLEALDDEESSDDEGPQNITPLRRRGDS